MLWLKTFHIFLVVSWFAGLFYLPRLYVNLAMVENAEPTTRERLLLMSRKLYRFMTPIGVLALATGLWLWLGFRIGGGWMYAKLALVLALVGFHLWCARLLRDFEAGRNTRSHVWYRWFNEFPVPILLAVTALVVIKPF